MRGKLFAALLVAVPLAGARAAAPDIRVDPPPGWARVATKNRNPLYVAGLRGPEQSSFQLMRVVGVPLDNAGAVRLYLRDVFEGIRAGARLDFKSDGRVERRTFRNGVVAHLLRADLDGKPRLVVALVEAGGTTLAATLNSAAPEAMLASLFEAVSYPRVEGAVQESGVARSSDGQLEVALGGGLRSRSLTEKEKADGFVLVMEGAGSQLLFQRIEDDSTPVGEQAAIVRAVAASAAGAVEGSASSPAGAPTPAGPVAVYSWTRLTDAAAGRFAVGFLPWGYWGYSLLARGPAADELLTGVLAALKSGPNTVPGILAATPAIPLEAQASDRRLLLAGAAAACVLLGLAVWSRSRKNANVSA